MHEARLVRDLVAEIAKVADAEGTDHIDLVKIEIGALSHVTPESLEGQFELLAHGTPAAEAVLDISQSADRTADFAHDVRLVSVGVRSG